MRPEAVLFDLFHTLACVPPPALAGEEPVPQILGVPAAEWQRRYYEDDVSAAVSAGCETASRRCGS